MNQQLGLEHDNFHTALDHFIRSGEADLEMRLVAAIWKFWFDQGLWQESRRAIDRSLAASSVTSPARVVVMLGAAWTAWRQGDTRTGTELAEESLRLSRSLDDPRLIARSLRVLSVCVMSGDPERSSALMEEAVSRSEALGDRAGVAAILNNLAVLAFDGGDHRRATAGFERAVSIARAIGDQRGTSVSLMNLAHSEVGLGELAQARAHFAESLATARKLGIREVVVESLHGLATLAASEGEFGWAGAFIGVAQREGDFGYRLEDRDQPRYERTIADIRGALGDDGMEKALAAGRAMSLDSAVRYLEVGAVAERPLAPPVDA